MGLPNRARGSFKNLEFPKLGSELITAALDQRDLALAKIEERQGRIKALCGEKGLDVADFFANADEFYGSATALSLQAGELAQLREESSQITSEKKLVKELSLLINNLPADKTFTLDFSELEYFGF